jgi:hypothetical protein
MLQAETESFLPPNDDQRASSGNEERVGKSMFPLSTQGKIFKWQAISAFGKILDGSIRGIEPGPTGC